MKKINLTQRSDSAKIKRQQEKVSSSPNLISLLETMPHIVMILNPYRQIVWANHCLSSTLKKENFDEFIGLRPGEVFKCANALSAEYGCGTSKRCLVCGFLLAIIQSLNENGAEKECMILTTNNDTLNLSIKAGLIDVDGEVFDCVSVVDISSEKSKRMMERVFFHDTMNLAGSIQGFVKMLPEMLHEDTDDIHHTLTVLSNSTDDLIDQIKWQKDLFSAQVSELNIYNKEINANQLLRDIKQIFQRNGYFKNRLITILDQQQEINFTSDQRILRRIIINAVKNALEAVNTGQEIQLRCKTDEDYVLFEIHNDSFIPQEIQNFVFRKSFSTKSQDRGLGTYSIKLFTEKYLKGKAWFTSTKKQGTTFYIKIPNLVAS